MPLSIPLLPVDSLVVTTLVDNVFDMFMPDQGPAHRLAEWVEDVSDPMTAVVGRTPAVYAGAEQAVRN